MIYDAAGVLLADNRSSLSLEITLEEVEDPNNTIAKLGTLIDIGANDLRHLTRMRKLRRRFEEIPIRSNLNPEEVARFAVNSHRFQGVAIRAQLLRAYPLGEHTAHVLSYVGRINKQKLKRINTANYIGTNYIGRGGVERACEDRRRGAVVAIDPRTGGVFTLVSRPSFDPNLFVDGISAVDYKALRDSPAKPLFNRTIRGQYSPGSTIKPFIALGGLESRTIGSTTTKWCRGYHRLPGHAHKYRCWNRWGHGTTTLEKAIVQSCDVYFYKLALAMGRSTGHDFLARFGFGARTGIDVTGERRGLLHQKLGKGTRTISPGSPGEPLSWVSGRARFWLHRYSLPLRRRL